MDYKIIGRKIRNAFRNKKDTSAIDLLLDAPEIQAGPCDGGCLVLAKALLHIIPQSKLVRLDYRLPGEGEGDWAPDHYGVQVPEGGIIDGDGFHSSPSAWRRHHLVDTKELRFVAGYKESDDIPDYAWITKRLVSVLSSVVGESKEIDMRDEMHEAMSKDFVFDNAAEWVVAWVWGHEGKDATQIPFPSPEVIRELRKYRPTSKISVWRAHKKAEPSYPLETWTADKDLAVSIVDETISDGVRTGKKGIDPADRWYQLTMLTTELERLTLKQIQQRFKKAGLSYEVLARQVGDTLNAGKQLIVSVIEALSVALDSADIEIEDPSQSNISPENIFDMISAIEGVDPDSVDVNKATKRIDLVLRSLALLGYIKDLSVQSEQTEKPKKIDFDTVGYEDRDYEVTNKGLDWIHGEDPYPEFGNALSGLGFTVDLLNGIVAAVNHTIRGGDVSIDTEGVVEFIDLHDDEIRGWRRAPDNYKKRWVNAVLMTYEIYGLIELTKEKRQEGVPMKTVTLDEDITKSQLAELFQVIENMEQQHPDSAELKKIREEARRLNEELSIGDWARIGAVLGLLWGKLDTIIKHLSDISNAAARSAAAPRR